MSECSLGEGCPADESLLSSDRGVLSGIFLIDRDRRSLSCISCSSGPGGGELPLGPVISSSFCMLKSQSKLLKFLPGTVDPHKTTGNYRGHLLPVKSFSHATCSAAAAFCITSYDQCAEVRVLMSKLDASRSLFRTQIKFSPRSYVRCLPRASRIDENIFIRRSRYDTLHCIH